MMSTTLLSLVVSAKFDCTVSLLYFQKISILFDLMVSMIRLNLDLAMSPTLPSHDSAQISKVNILANSLLFAEIF